MISLTIRRFVVGPIVDAARTATHHVTEDVGTSGGSEYATAPTDARLWLVRLRDVRRPEVRLMAERLDTHRWRLYLAGVDARVGADEGGRSLIAPSTAVIGRFVEQHVGGRTYVTCDGSGLAGPLYSITR